jgi:hypothetical protein
MLDIPTRHKRMLGLNDEKDENDEDGAFWGRYKDAAGVGVPTEGMRWLRTGESAKEEE